MTSPQHEFRNLLSLTQSYLLTEFKSRQRIFSDPETYEFFKQYQPKPKIVQQQVVARPQQVVPEQKPPSSRQQLQPKPLPPSQKPQNTEEKPPTPTAPPIETKTQEPSTTQATPQYGKSKRFTFKLEPLSEIKEIELSSIKKEIEKQFPEKQIIHNPPEDSVAKKIGEQWKQETKPPEVVILSFQEHPDRQVFLQNMKTAINQRLAPCVIYSAQTIESKQAWDKLFNMNNLRLIVTTDYGMYSLPGLMKHYRESPEKAQRYLGGVPVLLLTDISLYLKQPQLKSALWQALCTMLPNNQPT